MTQKKQNYFKTVGLLVFRPKKPANRHNVTAFYAPCTYFVNIYCTVLPLYILYIFLLYEILLHICLKTPQKKPKKECDH